MYLILLTFSVFSFSMDINCFLAFDKKINHNRVQAAYELASDYHFYQMRKIEGKKYIVHPNRVATSVYKYTRNEDLVISALLHDTLEDTVVIAKDIENLFGKRVSTIVRELSSNPTQVEKLGKAAYLSRKLNKISSEALTIKLLDRLDNLRDIKIASKSWAKKYKEETVYMLNNLNRELNMNQKEIVLLIRRSIL